MIKVGMNITFYDAQKEIGYIRSAYNERGFDNMLVASVKKGLEYIFKPTQVGENVLKQDEISAMIIRAREVREELVQFDGTIVETELMYLPMKMFGGLSVNFRQQSNLTRGSVSQGLIRSLIN
jgi:hypothetical protein